MAIPGPVIPFVAPPTAAGGGRAGVIVPNGVLFGSTNAATKLRELLLTTCDLQAVINLPSGVFKPYSGVGTVVLIFQKGPAKFDGTKSVWFYDLTADGFSLDDKGTPIEPQIHPRYLRFFLVGDPFRRRFMQAVSGVGGSLLRAKVPEVAKIQIPVSPLTQQERIVKLLDEADELRKLRMQADRRTADLIPALLHEMFFPQVLQTKDLQVSLTALEATISRKWG